MTAHPLRQNADAIPRVLSSVDSESAIYRDGRYLKSNPSWHIEESPFKVRQIQRMIKQQKLAPKTVCDVGCGAGLVLAELQPHFPSDCVCWGYDVSPDALAMSAGRANDRLRFRLRDIRNDQCDTYFDLLLMLDVFEHVEDYMGLVRSVRSKAKQKLFHIPLDLSVQAVLRKNGLLLRRDHHAHLHYFTRETALRTLTDVGYTIVDYFYTPRCIELGDLVIQRMVRIPRQLSFALAPDLTVRVLGGYSLMVLAE
jgi:SAM-dependent methyltransferase